MRIFLFVFFCLSLSFTSFDDVNLPAALFEKHIDTGSPLSCSPCLQLSSQGLEQTLPRISGKKNVCRSNYSVKRTLASSISVIKHMFGV